MEEEGSLEQEVEASMRRIYSEILKGGLGYNDKGERRGQREDGLYGKERKR